MARKKHRYLVRLSSHSTHIVFATDATSAKSKVWSEIKDGYTYGYDNRKQFMKGVTAKRG